MTAIIGAGAPAALPYPASSDPAAAAGNVGLPFANRTYFYRSVGAAGVCSKIGAEVAAQAGNVCLAVYSSVGAGRAARPDVRKATTGAVACPAVGYVELALDAPVNIAAGDWLAIGVDGAASGFMGFGGARGTALPNGRVAKLDGVFPCPASAAAATTEYGPIVGLVGVV